MKEAALLLLRVWQVRRKDETIPLVLSVICASHIDIVCLTRSTGPSNTRSTYPQQFCPRTDIVRKLREPASVGHLVISLKQTWYS